MEGLTRDLVIATAGAVIGAALVYYSSVGFQLTTKARKAAQQRRRIDIEDWKSGDFSKRQRVFNVYLFSVLRLFIIGTILIQVGSVVGDLEPNERGIQSLDYVTATIDAFAVICFALTLGEILRFIKLVRA
jgi:hypothetical protein